MKLMKAALVERIILLGCLLFNLISSWFMEAAEAEMSKINPVQKQKRGE